MATQASRRGRRRRSSSDAATSSSAHALASLATLRPSLIALLAAIPHRLSLLVAAAPAALFAQLPAYYNRATSVDVESLDPDVAGALKHSCDGRHLISYADLPAAWHNNPYISTGYRCVPTILSTYALKR
jgi:hypothetical protein